MTRALFLLLILGCLPVSAQAQGPLRSMGWEDTKDDSNHDSHLNCGALPDKSKLVVSFKAPAGIQSLERIFGYVDLCTKPYPVLPWWTFDPYTTGCRSHGLSANADFAAGPFTHTDPWGGRGQTYMVYGASPGGSWEMARITVDVTMTPGAPIPLVAGQEYYAFQIEFANPDVGCGGCELPACFVLNGLLIYHDGGYVEPTTMDFYSNYVRWQGGQSDCPFIVPTLPTSWGRLKEIYR